MSNVVLLLSCDVHARRVVVPFDDWACRVPHREKMNETIEARITFIALTSGFVVLFSLVAA